MVQAQDLVHGVRCAGAEEVPPGHVTSLPSGNGLYILALPRRAMRRQPGDASRMKENHAKLDRDHLP